MSRGGVERSAVAERLTRRRATDASLLPTPRQRFREVPPPEPILSREREAALTARQREILDSLVELFAGGFAHLTMVNIANRLKCSLRTLYAIADTRDELMLIGVERFLWRVGRSARNVITDDSTALDALAAYLHATTLGLTAPSSKFGRDLALVPAVKILSVRQNDYVYEVTHALLDLAVERGEILPVDTAALGRVMAGLGTWFLRPEIRSSTVTTPKEAADGVVDVIIRGLRAT